MDHPTEKEILAYFEGQLKGERFNAVDNHIQTCNDCQDTLAFVQQLPPDPTEEPHS